MGCPQNLVCGQEVDCGTKPAEHEPADCYLQCLIHNTPPGGTLVLEARRWLLDGLPDPLNGNPGNANEFRIPIRKPITIDFNGAELFFARIPGGEDRKKGFLVVPDIHDCYGWRDQEFPFVVFRNGRFIGDSIEADDIPFDNYFGVISTSSENPLELKIGRMEVDSCLFKNLSAGVVFNAFSKGHIRQSVLTNCVFDNIVVDPDELNDTERGRAATFNLPYQKPTECSGLSLGNVFRNCERHSLYVFSGGPFLSEGDKFINGSLGNVGNYPIAAVSLKGGSGYNEETGAPGLQGGSHMRVANGYFENCKVGIALTRARPNHPDAPPPLEEVIPFEDVSISDCRFVTTDLGANEFFRDIVLNNSDPETNGLWRNVVVERTSHWHLKRDQTAINVGTFQNLILRDVTFHLQQQSPVQDDYGSIFIFGYGTVSRDLLIERVIATYDPPPPTFARLIVLDSNVTGTANGSPSVIIRDISMPTGAIYKPVYPVPNAAHPFYANGNVYVNVDPYFS